MTVSERQTIDFVTHNPKTGIVCLVMVECRKWGNVGCLLPDLQEKFNTYLVFATEGQLAKDFPKLSGKMIRFELRTLHRPGRRELEFFRIVRANYLKPEKIRFKWKQYKMIQEKKS